MISRRIALYDRLREPVSELSAELVELASRDEKSVADVGGQASEPEHSISELRELLLHGRDISRSVLSGGGHLARHSLRNIAANSRHRDRLAVPYHGVHIDGMHLPRRAVELMYLRDKRAGGGDVVLLANAEHILPFPRKIAIREAAAGEYPAQELHIGLFAAESFFQLIHRRSHILGALHPALYFQRIYAYFAELVRASEEG